jgi:acyl-CoA reductase-like NAD-dependent aldehyde dehydrogenase
LRQRVLSEMADRLDAHAEELARWSQGRPATRQPKGLFEGASPGHTLRHAAAPALTDTAISAEISPGERFSTYAEPARVVAIVVGQWLQNLLDPDVVNHLVAPDSIYSR